MFKIKNYKSDEIKTIDKEYDYQGADGTDYPAIAILKIEENGECSVISDRCLVGRSAWSYEGDEENIDPEWSATNELELWDKEAIEQTFNVKLER